MTKVPSVLALIESRKDYTVWWRVIWPFAQMRQRGMRVATVLYDDLPRVDVSEFDVLLTPRVTIGGDHPLMGWLDEQRKQGKRWLYDADDDLWSDEFVERQTWMAQTTTRTERRWVRQQNMRHLDQRRALLRRCDGITVSSEHLANRVRSYTGAPVRVVPNRIDTGWFDRGLQAHPRMVPGLTVGWAGGGRPDSDFEPLAQAWSELARRHAGVTFVLYGYEAKPLVLAVPEDRLAIVAWAPIDLYPAGLKNIDIACCVLPDTPANRGKSANKWLEHSLASTPAVVSPTVYGEVVYDDWNALVASTATEWVEQIERLIASPELRKDIGRNARASVLAEHALADHWQSWPTAWQEILA